MRGQLEVKSFSAAVSSSVLTCSEGHTTPPPAPLGLVKIPRISQWHCIFLQDKRKKIYSPIILDIFVPVSLTQCAFSMDSQFATLHHEETIMSGVRRHISCVMCHMSRVMCHMSCVRCHMSCVMCHMSCVTCHVWHVTCHLSLVTNTNSNRRSPY